MPPVQLSISFCQGLGVGLLGGFLGLAVGLVELLLVLGVLLLDRLEEGGVLLLDLLEIGVGRWRICSALAGYFSSAALAA